MKIKKLLGLEGVIKIHEEKLSDFKYNIEGVNNLGESFKKASEIIPQISDEKFLCGEGENKVIYISFKFGSDKTTKVIDISQWGYSKGKYYNLVMSEISTILRSAFLDCYHKALAFAHEAESELKDFEEKDIKI